MIRDLTIDTGAAGTVSAILNQPDDAWAVFVLAHGAGAGMRHAFMETTATNLATRGIATLRYQFPYMEQGTGRPDPPARAEATVGAAVSTATHLAPRLPIFAGGKSFGGRMTSGAAANQLLEHARGLIFLGFPLHAPGREGVERAEHLAWVKQPMLFIQGTRDTLADLTLMKGVLKKLGSRAELEVIEGGDHSFKVQKRSGRTAVDVEAQLSDAIVSFCRAHLEEAG